MTTSEPVMVSARRDDTNAATGGRGPVVLLLLAAAATALTAVPHLMLVSRFLRLPPSPARPDLRFVLFELEVVQDPVFLVIGAVLVIAVRSAWSTWGPALLVGVTGHGLLLGALTWFRVWNGHTAAERRTIVALVVLTVAALAVAVGLALAARPGAPDRRPQPAWTRPALLIPVQALAVAAALLIAASTWALDRPHAALYAAVRVFVSWIQPTVSSILGYGRFELVGGAGPIARNVGAFAALAAVAVVRDSRRWATATGPVG